MKVVGKDDLLKILNELQTSIKESDQETYFINFKFERQNIEVMKSRFEYNQGQYKEFIPAKGFEFSIEIKC